MNTCNSINWHNQPKLKFNEHVAYKIKGSVYIHDYRAHYFHSAMYTTDAWRLSTLSVIHKKGDKTEPKNYRGIAVSSNLCKLFCIVLHNRLTTFCDSHKVIPCEQIGFRKGSRTQDHILVLKTIIDKYISKSKKLFICFIDFSSAFDTIWRNALIYKLVKAGVGGNMIKIIQNMYSSVNFSVKCSTKYTESFSSSVGVKQGCVLSPLFFNIYLSDLPDIFNNTCDPVTLNNSTLSCLMYADDLIIMSDSSNGLQTALNNLHAYCLKWKLCVNIDKTKIMIFNRGGHILNSFPFSYGHVPLQICNEYSYLGIMFTPSGSFTKAINILKEKANKVFFKIRENLYSSSCKCSLKLFHTPIKPILTYGCEIWAPYLLKGLKDENFIDICDKPSSENIHVKVCKLILGVHRKATNNAVRGELGSYPLLISMLTLSFKYWWKLNQDCSFGSSSLVVQALIENRSFQYGYYFTWSKGIKSICSLINNNDIWDRPNILSKSSISDLVSSSLKSKYDQEWYSHISTKQMKLRTYCQFKKSFNQENYVHILNQVQKSVFCKLRISAHTLMIEKGRYSYPKIPPENRLCTVCDLQETENEFHFIMRCKAYTHLRQDLLSHMNDTFNTDNFSDNDYFVKIMSATDFDNVKIVANFVSDAFNIRSNIVV